MSKTAFLFAGQGSQFPGMMKEFYDNIPACREVFEKVKLKCDIGSACDFFKEANENAANHLIAAVA